MRFMLIANATKESESGAPPKPELIAAIGKLMEEMTSAGKLVGGGGLLPSSLGAKLSLSGGKITFTDGPYAEAKELIGGYGIVEVASKEEAIEISRRFLQIHADVMGPSFELHSQIRQMSE